MMLLWRRATVKASLQCCAIIQLHELTIPVKGLAGLGSGTGSGNRPKIVAHLGAFSGAFAASGCSFHGQFGPDCEPGDLKGYGSCNTLAVQKGSVHSGADCPSD